MTNNMTCSIIQHMKIRAITIFVLALATVVTVANKPAFADEGAYGQYGQYPTASQTILMDKMVAYDVASKGAVENTDYVDNLSVSDYHFKPNQQVYFKLKVKNTSDNKLTDVVVTDTLPDYVTFVDGDGTYNKDDNSVTVKAGDLDANQEKNFYITTKILNQDQLPSDKGIVCMTNKSSVNTDQGATDGDTAQFCVEKEVLGVQNVPATGPELWAFLTATQLIALGAGLKLRKMS